MLHTIAFFEAITGVAAQEINAVQGTAEYVQNSRHVFDKDWLLVGAFVTGVTLVRARLLAPSLRIVAPPQIRPVNVGAVPGTDPNVADYRRAPIVLKAREELAIETVQTAAGAEDKYAVLFLSDGVHTLPQGNAYIIRAVGATTAVVATWTNVPLTYDDQLPAGEYEIIGFEAIGTTIQAARIVFPGRNLYRPGCIGQANVGGKPYILSNAWNGMGFIDGGFGSYGRFSTTALPTVEVLCSAADTAQTVYMKCIQVARY